MKPQPIDATKIVLRALRVLNDARLAADAGWQRLSGTTKPTSPSSERRRGPQIW